MPETAVVNDTKENNTNIKKHRYESLMGTRHKKDACNERTKQYIVRDLQQCMDASLNEYWVESSENLQHNTSWHETHSKSWSSDVEDNNHLSAADNTVEKGSQDPESSEKGSGAKTEKCQSSMEMNGANDSIEKGFVEKKKGNVNEEICKKRDIQCVDEAVRKVDGVDGSVALIILSRSVRAFNWKVSWQLFSSTFGDSGRIDLNSLFPHLLSFSEWANNSTELKLWYHCCNSWSLNHESADCSCFDIHQSFICLTGKATVAFYGRAVTMKFFYIFSYFFPFPS